MSGEVPKPKLLRQYGKNKISYSKLLLLVVLLFSIFMQKFKQKRSLFYLFIVTLFDFCYYLKFKRNMHTQYRNIIVDTIIVSLANEFDIFDSFVFLFSLSFKLVCFCVRWCVYHRLKKWENTQEMKTMGTYHLCMHVYILFYFILLVCLSVVMCDINKC